MAYERVQKTLGQSSSKKKHIPIVPPLNEEPTQAGSQLSPKLKPSRIPSSEEREAIKRKIFDSISRSGENQAMREGLFSPTVREQKTPDSASTIGMPIQPKLTIGAPGDKYEQEADRVAAQVVNRINAPVAQQSNENQEREEALEEDELQMKSEEGAIRREAMLEEEEELQMQTIVQLQPGAGGMIATPDLEASIQQARGGGQPLADNVRQPMEQAFGADFSGVKVHTDAQADQLNQSIQAYAFTTGQDVFFRSGEYQPESRGGQELIAHELTHVVQQVSAKSTINRFIDEAGDLGVSNPVKVSQNYKIVLESNQVAYATNEMIETANKAVDNNGKYKLAIIFEKGEEYKNTTHYHFPNPLYKILPKVRQETTFPVMGPMAGMKSKSPKEGDSEEQHKKSHQEYEEYVKQLSNDINEFVDEVTKTVRKAKISSHEDFEKPLSEEIKNDIGNHITQKLIASSRGTVLGPMLQIAIGALETKLFKEDGFTVIQIYTWLQWFKDHYQKEVKKELGASPTAIILPNDCSAAAATIAGKGHMSDYKSDTPDIGQAYMMGFSEDESGKTGWDTHWATVVMRDGDDRLTVETAVEPGRLAVGKSFWTFQMYGTAKGQTFEEQTKAANLEHKARQQQFLDNAHLNS